MPGIVAPVLSRFYTPANQSNCSGFFNDVSQELHAPVTRSPANDLIDKQITKRWIKIGTGPNFGPQAANFAGQGYLVVAVLTGSEHKDHRPHGHIAIVLPGPTEGGYPFVMAGGGSRGQSNGTLTVRSVWRPDDAPNVHYYRTPATYPQLMVK